MILLPS